MRQIFAISRSLCAVAFLGFSVVWAAIPALAADQETAAIAPLGQQRGSAPSILSEDDIDRYRVIFDLQQDGDWKSADSVIAELEDDLLMGHVLYQRYMHPTEYRSQFSELRDWMAEYADHPDADKIYALAVSRRPSDAPYPGKPRDVSLPSAHEVAEWQDGFETFTVDSAASSEKSRQFDGKTRAQIAEIKRVQNIVQRSVQRGSVSNALEYLDTRPHRALFDGVSFADSLGEIARGYYRYDMDDKAIAITERAYEFAQDGAARALWWGGLAAWRAGNYETAARFFEALSGSAEADGWLKAAGGFWASRAYLVGERPAEVSRMLRTAAVYPRTFYGLLATRALGQTAPLDFELPYLSEATGDILVRIPAAQRAIALAEAGQTSLADAELRRFVDELPPSLAVTLLALAEETGLADLSFRLGHEMARSQNVMLDGALYPIPGWEPENGFEIDRALVFGIVRQESRFRVRARSGAGARGLMQLMPATAEYIAGQSFQGAERAELYDPGLNLALGQKYIEYVLDYDGINGNLLYALTAYNAGPGNLIKWRNRIDYADDPLLYIESLPSRETRNYIEHVLANFWIYRMRLDQPPVSMDMLIGGLWPIYLPQDEMLRNGEIQPASGQ